MEKRGRRRLSILRAIALLGLAGIAAGGGGACSSADGDSAQVSTAEDGGSTSAPSSEGAAGAAPAAGAVSRGTILFVGTSLTAGYGLDPEFAYPLLVQQKIDSAGLPFDVVNAGVSGETSSSLLRRMEWLLRQPIDVIVIETGANDGLRGIPVEAMERNIQRIIDTVKAVRPDARIVLAQMEAPPNLGAGYTNRFRRAFSDLARRNQVTLLPFILEGVAGVRELNQGDGIHPNLRGERIVAENVWRGLRPVLQ